MTLPRREARAALSDQRAEVASRLRIAEHDFARIVEAAESVSTDDEHDPDGAGLAVERAQIVAVIEQARRHLAEIDAAVMRLDADEAGVGAAGGGGYGICHGCGEPIPRERLLARPHATQCVSCASGRR
ncbi:MAG: TraR/DksA C4-type zinc finger protein [Kineosporiaceae bacterium]